jgi:hypothetical protein
VRIRSTKPEFWRSLTVAKLTIPARLTFKGVWNYCDDYGRGMDSSHLLKADLYPHDDDIVPAVVERHLQQMEDVGLIVRYRVGAKRYLAVTNWEEHQRVDHPKESTIPQPPADLIASAREGLAQLRADFGNLPEKSPPEVEVEVEQGGGAGSREVEHVAPPARLAKSRDELFEAVAEACGIDWHGLTASARGPINKAAGELRDAKVSPDEVRRRAQNWPSLFDAVTTLTPTALVKYWGSLSSRRVVASSSTTALMALADQMEAQ